jgi:branched-chain amino acid aminotransferase
MPVKESKYIWHEGKLVPWAKATTHVLSHALHYGSSVFEGIRVYKTPSGPVGFRLTDHVRRMFDSAKVYRLIIPYSEDELVGACRAVIVENGLTDGAYIRPIAYRGYGEMGVAGDISQPACCAIAAWEWGSYLGDGGLEKGVDVCISSWQRVAPNTVPTLAKASGNYLSSILITLEARRLGFTEGIALNTSGFVSEGAGENLFLVRDGKIYTPPVAATRCSSSQRPADTRSSSRTFRASCCISRTKSFLRARPQKSRRFAPSIRFPSARVPADPSPSSYRTSSLGCSMAP